MCYVYIIVFILSKMNVSKKDGLIISLRKLWQEGGHLRCTHINGHILYTLKKILQTYLQPQTQIDLSEPLFEIDTVLDYLHDELNTGHWSTVPIEARQNFTIASYLKSLCLLHSHATSDQSDLLKQCLRAVDMGLLLGAPLEENPQLLCDAALVLRQQLQNVQDSIAVPKSTAKRKVQDNLDSNFSSLKGVEVEELTVPSVETFNRKFFIPQIPVKLKDCMSHWPAMKKWVDLEYLLKIAGSRTVPIEIGSHYTDASWSQKLMTVEEFIRNHYLSDTGNVGYLAQHNLFDQISELRADICVPEYCCCSSDYEQSTEPDINAWLGPKGTVSPLHQDPKNNILCQVYGTKQVLLYPPKDTEYLYPHDEQMLSNTARVDPLDPDFSSFPDFAKAGMFKCLLGPGEMLFIPVKWWHHVSALEKSFSVSFWWQ